MADYGFQLYRDSPFKLTAYSDADWAGCKLTVSAWREDPSSSGESMVKENSISKFY